MFKIRQQRLIPSHSEKFL